MRVLHLHQTDQGGGGAKIVRELHKNLNKRDEINSKLVVGSKKTEGAEVYELSKLPLENVFNFGFERILSLDGLGSPSSYRVNSIVDKFSPDLIHLHNLHGSYFNILNISRLPRDIPIVWTFHDMWPFTGHCCYSFDCEKYQNGCGGCPYLDVPDSIKFDTTRLLNRTKIKLINNREVSIISPSKWMSNKIYKSKLNNHTVKFLPHGIDTKVFSPVSSPRDEFGISKEEDLILFIANNPSNKRKGIQDLKSALNSISVKNLSILIVGGDDFDVSSIPERYNVYNPGYISNKQLPSAYSAADLCVTPSHYESFGLVATESMACETPVVAYDTSGLSEQIDSTRGWLAKHKDINDLASKITSAFSNKALLKQKGKQARLYAVKNHNQSKFVDQHQKFYQKLI